MEKNKNITTESQLQEMLLNSLASKKVQLIILPACLFVNVIKELFRKYIYKNITLHPKGYCLS
jgi:hypothetical protein